MWDKLAAQVLSEAVKNSGLPYESQQFTLEAAEAKNHKGDLLRYVPAGPVLEHFGLSSAALKQSIAVKAQDEELSEEALQGFVHSFLIRKNHKSSFVEATTGPSKARSFTSVSSSSRSGSDPSTTPAPA